MSTTNPSETIRRPLFDLSADAIFGTPVIILLAIGKSLDTSSQACWAALETCAAWQQILLGAILLFIARAVVYAFAYILQDFISAKLLGYKLVRIPFLLVIAGALAAIAYLYVLTTGGIPTGLQPLLQPFGLVLVYVALLAGSVVMLMVVALIVSLWKLLSLFRPAPPRRVNGQ